MKRFVVVLTVALMVSGMVWGQETYSPPASTVFDIFKKFTAVSTQSTEKRYSAGRFSTDVDNYIDARKHNPAIGTFFFLGGYPAGKTVEKTDPVTPGYAISLGAGRTVNDKLYLGLYYAGNFVDGEGSKYSDSDPKKYNTDSEARWKNNVAILLGIAGMGFRLDIVDATTGTTVKNSTIDADDKSKEDSWTGGTGISLTWSTNIEQSGKPKLSPFAQIGYKFPSNYISSDEAGKKLTVSEGAALGLKAGAVLGFSKVSEADATVFIGGLLPDSYGGDKDRLMGHGSEDPFTKEGMFGIGLKAGFSQTINSDPLTIKFYPNLSMGFNTFSNNNTSSAHKDDKKPASDDYFSFALAFDLGIKYQINNKFALYTGAGFKIFEYNIHSYGGGEDEGSPPKSSANEWEVKGISWDSKKSAAGGNLGFGLTFTPSDNIVVGFGLNTLLDKLFTVNFQDMTVTSGTWLGAAHTAPNFLGEVLTIFTDTKFDLTVSFKF